MKMPLSQFLSLWHSSILRRVSCFLPATGKCPSLFSILFYFPLTWMSGLHKGQNQGGTALLPGLLPTPVGLKRWLFHKEVHSSGYFVSQTDLSGLKPSESLTMKPKLALLRNLLTSFFDGGLGTPNPFLSLVCHTAKHQSFTSSRMGEEQHQKGTLKISSEEGWATTFDTNLHF